MNLTFPALTACCAMLFPNATSVQGQTLFFDSFDRSDNSDLNALATGKSGTLGALDWIEVASGGNPAISGNTLKFGESGGGGGGWSIVYPAHNFTDSVITNGGEFTVSVDLGSGLASTGGTRLTGFAVGHSEGEVSGWSSNLPASFNSDFFFGYDPTSSGPAVGSYIFGNGTQDFYSNVNLSAAGGTLSVRFSGISDFTAGSSVTYEAFINGGSPVKTGSFTWSGTDENYLALYSNYSLDRGVLDNFEVRAAAAAAVTAPKISSITVSGTTATVVMTGAPATDYYCAGSSDLTSWATEIVPTDTSGSPFQTEASGNLTFTVDISSVASSYYFRIQDFDPSP